MPTKRTYIPAEYKKFTVNGEPFEVRLDVYRRYFTLSELSDESSTFEDVDDYTIESPGEHVDEELLVPSIEAIIVGLENHMYSHYDYFTGEVKEVRSAYKVDLDFVENVKPMVSPSIVTQFLDKYIKEPKKVIGILIPSVKHIMRCLDAGNFYTYIQEYHHTLNLLSNILGPLYKLEDNGDSMYDTCESDVAPFYVTKREQTWPRSDRIAVSYRMMNILYMMLYYIFVKYGTFPVNNEYIQHYIDHYVKFEDVFNVNVWLKNNEGFVPPDPYTLAKKIKQCEEFISETDGHNN